MGDGLDLALERQRRIADEAAVDQRALLDPADADIVEMREEHADPVHAAHGLAVEIEGRAAVDGGLAVEHQRRDVARAGLDLGRDVAPAPVDLAGLLGGVVPDARDEPAALDVEVEPAQQAALLVDHLAGHDVVARHEGDAVRLLELGGPVDARLVRQPAQPGDRVDQLGEAACRRRGRRLGRRHVRLVGVAARGLGEPVGRVDRDGEGALGGAALPVRDPVGERLGSRKAGIGLVDQAPVRDRHGAVERAARGGEDQRVAVRVAVVGQHVDLGRGAGDGRRLVPRRDGSVVHRVDGDEHRGRGDAARRVGHGVGEHVLAVEIGRRRVADRAVLERHAPRRRIAELEDGEAGPVVGEHVDRQAGVLVEPGGVVDRHGRHDRRPVGDAPVLEHEGRRVGREHLAAAARLRMEGEGQQMRARREAAAVAIVPAVVAEERVGQEALGLHHRPVERERHAADAPRERVVLRDRHVEAQAGEQVGRERDPGAGDDLADLGVARRVDQREHRVGRAERRRRGLRRERRREPRRAGREGRGGDGRALPAGRGARPLELKRLPPAVLEVAEVEGVLAGREIDGRGERAVRVQAVVVDHRRAADRERRAVVGGEIEGVGAALGHDQLAGERRREAILRPALPERRAALRVVDGLDDRRGVRRAGEIHLGEARHPAVEGEELRAQAGGERRARDRERQNPLGHLRLRHRLAEQRLGGRHETLLERHWRRAGRGGNADRDGTRPGSAGRDDRHRQKRGLGEAERQRAGGEIDPADADRRGLGVGFQNVAPGIQQQVAREAQHQLVDRPVGQRGIAQARRILAQNRAERVA